MNRFKKGQYLLKFKNKIKAISILLFVVISIILITAIKKTGDDTVARQRESLENALKRDIVHCYAVEGTYPPSLQYMKDHYGLTYDEQLFFVDYTPIGANIYPNITILTKNEQKSDVNELFK